ncbi:MAG TPA: twin-arginine translocase TatA/TatE family subunit [Pirellulales bacterium]|jgi:sec-independent protein translocase protein TatA|nr:twin-arginine translocase TatA/TatE family subunit [Pirellulales bacterium]
MSIGTAMLFAFLPGPSDMMVIGVVAVLLFGKNLPQVARQAGRALSELKKGMAGIQSELNSAIYDSDSSSSSTYRQSSSSFASYRDDDDRDEQTAPKFEPPPAEPSIEGPPA